jgi:site-specific recombinase XerD
VRRLKDSKDSMQPLQSNALRALHPPRREAPEERAFVFLSERRAPFTTDGFRKKLMRAAGAAGLGHLNANRHGLRHGAGHYLAERGTDTRTIQDYPGHRDIRQTAQYTKNSVRCRRRAAAPDARIETIETIEQLATVRRRCVAAVGATRGPSRSGVLQAA